MATFKACVQKERKDGFYPVYIRVTHHRGTQFMKTDKMVTKKELSRAKEIEDPYVLQYCAGRIVEYNERLNKKDIEHWTVKEVVDFLTNGNDDICFSDYARVHIDRMIDRGPESKMKYPQTEFGRDVAMMVLCLAGINTIDLYNLRKQDYRNGIIHYQRAKTKKFRADGAYMEMRVPAIIQPLFEKYMNTAKDDERLFSFYQRMTTSDSFCANVNSGIRQLCKAMGMPKEEWYSAYTFRHTWGTVAQNDVRASISEVAFGMNHSNGHNVTRGYIKIDFSPAWELNEKVIDFIFFSGKASVREQKQEDVHFRLSYRYMVNAAAYHNGQKVAELTDVGFNNVDEVIARLVTMLPDDIPNRSMVMFKIVNLDKDQTVVYQRQKGKGF